MSEWSWDDVPGKFPRAHYQVDVSWRHIERSWINGIGADHGINLDPDYQREHVWSEEQQRGYLEYCLRGGEGARVLYWNCIGWDSMNPGRLELVDGKQRLQAVRRFIAGDIEVFGHRYKPGQRLRLMHGFKMMVASLPTRSDVLRWYLAINAGGTPHTGDELARVRELLRKEEMMHG